MKSLAEARIKRNLALKLAAEGRSFDQIAQEVGFGHRGSAHRAVYKALAEHEAENVHHLRALEMARLDYMLSRIWHRIEQGDVEAISTALKISDARCRIMGIHGPGRKRLSESDQLVALVQPDLKATQSKQPVQSPDTASA